MDTAESLNVSTGTANMVGVTLSTMTYGVHLTLFTELNRLYFDWVGRRRPSKRDWRLLAYVYVLFLLSTTGLCLQTWVYHDAFVIHGAFPGGPLAYLAQQTRHPIHVVMTVIYIVLNWFADGMLLYRAYVLSIHSNLVIVGCILTLMALIGVGGFFIHTVAVAGIGLWAECEWTPCITYLSLSFSINLVLTAGIISRLYYIRREFSSMLGPEVARVYTSIVAMLIESASLYTVVALLAIIACAQRIPMQDALLPMLGQLQAIPPLLIILRVMEGRAVTSDTWNSTVSFRRPSPSFSSAPSPASRGSMSKFGPGLDTSSARARSSHTCMSPFDDVKQTPVFDLDVPACASSHRQQREPLWVCTDMECFRSGSLTVLDEEIGCSSFDIATSLSTTPQSPPAAHTPRSTVTVTSLSRSPWL